MLEYFHKITVDTPDDPDVQLTRNKCCSACHNNTKMHLLQVIVFLIFIFFKKSLYLFTFFLEEHKGTPFLTLERFTSVWSPLLS